MNEKHIIKKHKVCCALAHRFTPRTFEAIWDSIPDCAKKSLTSKELRILAVAINKSYQNGRAYND